MKKKMGAGILVFLLSVVGSCGDFGIVLPGQVTITLDNRGDYDVDVTLYYDNDEDIPLFLLTRSGTRVEFQVDDDDTVTFFRDCDRVGAIVVSDARLRVLSGVGPRASSDVLRQGDDFECGDRIIFTFDHSDALLDFRVSDRVQSVVVAPVP